MSLVRSIGFLAMHGLAGSRRCWVSLGLLRVVSTGDAGSRMGWMNGISPPGSSQMGSSAWRWTVGADSFFVVSDGLFCSSAVRGGFDDTVEFSFLGRPYHGHALSRAECSSKPTVRWIRGYPKPSLCVFLFLFFSCSVEHSLKYRASFPEIAKIRALLDGHPRPQCTINS